MASSKKKSAVEKFTVEGELTIYTAAEMKEKIGALLKSESIEIDLSQVGEIDTAGLQLLLLAQRECAKQEKPIVFSNPSEAVLACWNMCNLKETFGVTAQ
jgi:anti-sigma B factor antagonist